MNIHINVDTVNSNNAFFHDNNSNLSNFNVVNMNMGMMNNHTINIPELPAEQNAENNQQANNEENNNEEAAVQEPIPLTAYPRAKRILVSALSCIVLTILCILLASVLPWFEVASGIKYYSQDQFLWLFLLPPLSAVPLMFSSITLMGRICWLHCWTVTVISIDVPSAVIFVSFGASLVYTGVGNVIWTAGAFLVVLAHIMSITGGLLFMKLAQIIEMGPPAQPEGPPKGPITVSIGTGDIDVNSHDSTKEIVYFESKPTTYGTTIVGGASH
jgi:hypothetical protein